MRTVRRTARARTSATTRTEPRSRHGCAPSTPARARTKIVGTWDDHDSGFNNAGARSRSPSRSVCSWTSSASPRTRRGGTRGSTRTTRSETWVGAETERAAHSARHAVPPAAGEGRAARRGPVAVAGEGAVAGPREKRRRQKCAGRRSRDGETRRRVVPRTGDREEADDGDVDVVVVGSSIQVHAETQRLVDGLFQGVESWNEFPARRSGCARRALARARRVPLRGRAPRRDHHQPGAVRAAVRARRDHQQRDDARHPGRGPKEVRPEGVRASAHPPFLPRWLWPDVGGLQRARFIQRNWEVAIDFGDEDEEGEDAEEARPASRADAESRRARRRRRRRPTTRRDSSARPDPSC